MYVFEISKKKCIKKIKTLIVSSKCKLDQTDLYNNIHTLYLINSVK